MNLIDYINNILDTPDPIQKVNELNDINYNFSGLEIEGLQLVDQALSTPIFNAKAALDIHKLPEGISSEDLYKIWVSALNELSIFRFLAKEFLKKKEN